MRTRYVPKPQSSNTFHCLEFRFKNSFAAFKLSIRVSAGLTNSVHFTEIRRIWADPNSKIAELLFIVSKFQKRIKISKKYVKKLDQILRLLVKKFL
jgi:hypothetical protein